MILSINRSEYSKLSLFQKNMEVILDYSSDTHFNHFLYNRYLIIYNKKRKNRQVF